MAPHSCTLAWKIPWTKEPGGLQSMRSLSRTRLRDFTFTFHFHALEKEMATRSSDLAWRIPGTGEPDGLPSMGSHSVGHNWRDLAAAAAERKRDFFFFCNVNELLIWLMSSHQSLLHITMSVISWTFFLWTLFLTLLRSLVSVFWNFLINAFILIGGSLH